MAITRQQIIDEKYDNFLAEKELVLMQLFSPEILTWARNKSADTFQEIKGLTGVLILSNKGLTEIKGLQFLPLINNLYLTNNSLSSVDVSNNADLSVLELDNNELTFLDVTYNTDLTILRVDKNSLTSIDVSNNVNLTQLRLNENNITSIDVSNNINLTQLRLFDNNLNTSAVDSVLSQCNTLRLGGTIFSAGIQLHGASNAIPTNGASNADYLDLTNAGILVIIRTS